MAARKKSTRKFQAEVSRLLHLVVHSLYSNKEIFLRELISNSSDAIDKVRLLSLTDESLRHDGEEFAIRVWADKDAGTITIEDNGVGMDKDALSTNLGTVAHSGTLKFLEQLQGNDDARLIGQFGVGFYSGFLVADEIAVTSKPAGDDAEAWTWRSDAQESYTLEPAERDGRGTTIVLHLKDDAKEFLDSWKLRKLIKDYSDYVEHPIHLGREPYGDDEAADEHGLKFEVVNQAKALWTRDPEDIEDHEYQDFYKHLSNDWEDSLAHTHFSVEGRQLFTGLLFIPKRPPFDLFQREHQRGVRLFVKRVFIMDKAEELVPVWLRFIKGVIDSDDLPLNVSRELLQDSNITTTIRKQVVKKTLDRLGTLLADDREAYEGFWGDFGAVLKEGLHVERAPKDQKRVGKIVLYRSTHSDGWTTLDEYVERMPEGQTSIYYVYGESQSAVAGSPHLEALRKKGFEVLLMTDAIDEWAVEGLSNWDDKPFVSAMKADLDLEEDEDEKKDREEKKEQLGGHPGGAPELPPDRLPGLPGGARGRPARVHGAPAQVPRPHHGDQQAHPGAQRRAPAHPEPAGHGREGRRRGRPVRVDRAALRPGAAD
jgi:molecular chaperone HtpG